MTWLAHSFHDFTIESSICLLWAVSSQSRQSHWHLLIGHLEDTQMVWKASHPEPSITNCDITFLWQRYTLRRQEEITSPWYMSPEYGSSISSELACDHMRILLEAGNKEQAYISLVTPGLEVSPGLRFLPAKYAALLSYNTWNQAANFALSSPRIGKLLVQISGLFKSHVSLYPAEKYAAFCVAPLPTILCNIQLI